MRVRRAVLFVLGLALIAPYAAHAESPLSPSVNSGSVNSLLHGTGGKQRHKTHHKVHRKPAPVQIKVQAGFNEEYRDGAWVPVHVTLRNRTAVTITGNAQIADSGNMNNGPPQQFRSMYDMQIIIPGGATKSVTLYVPSSSLDSALSVDFLVGGHTVASGFDAPSTFTSSDVSVGALATDPANTVWVKHAGTNALSVDVVPVTTQTFDPLPEALANLDVIVLTDGATSQLTHDQIQALDQYVHRGGALVEVGGPGWQENLNGLPADLIPGRALGTRTVAGLSGLRTFSRDLFPGAASPTEISVLSRPNGSVLAQQGSLPLVVQSQVGQGQVAYLAFDPTLDPVSRWHGEGALISKLIMRVAPRAVARALLPQQMQGGPVFGGGQTMMFGPFGPMDITSELSNVPAAALPSVVLFILLTVLYVIFLGPINYYVLRRLRRRELLWVSVPAGSLLCVAATFGVAFHLKGNTVLINSVGVIQLDGSTGPQPMSLYLGLFAPVRGDYALTYNAPSLPAMVPSYTYYGPGPGTSNRPIGLRLQEGDQTQVQFPAMNMWSMRDVALHSTIRVPGGIRSQLHLDRKGYIVGAVHNDTALTLQHPAIIAGRTAYKLRDMPPESTVPVHIKPYSSIYEYHRDPIWYSLYGRPGFNQPIMAGAMGFFGQGPVGMFRGPCCAPVGMSAPPEHSLVDRIKNVASRLPEAQLVSSVGEVTFVGWTTQPLGSISVDGASPQRRDLTLIEAPLSVAFNSGPLVLRTGTIGARLVELNPAFGSSNFCCGPPNGQSIAIAAGGFATFEFDLPRAGRVHLKTLHLYVNAGGGDGADLGRVFDYQTNRWVHEDLSQGYAILKHPQRFLSSSGAILIRLIPSDFGNAVRISDVHTDLQISGSGVVS